MRPTIKGRNLQGRLQEPVTAKIPSINISINSIWVSKKARWNEQVKYGCQWAIKHFSAAKAINKTSFHLPALSTSLSNESNWMFWYTLKMHGMKIKDYRCNNDEKQLNITMNQWLGYKLGINRGLTQNYFISATKTGILASSNQSFWNMKYDLTELVDRCKSTM